MMFINDQMTRITKTIVALLRNHSTDIFLFP